MYFKLKLQPSTTNWLSVLHNKNCCIKINIISISCTHHILSKCSLHWCYHHSQW